MADFAKIVEIFDKQTISFVSVTQAFNTTSSMGRLTLNVLLSFAQFEREVTGERIRDKIAASKKKGMWMGGQPPLGYDVQDRKLIVNEGEADTVRLIFEQYARLKSVRSLQQELDRRGIVSKARRLANGTAYGANRSVEALSTRCCRTGSIEVRSCTRVQLTQACTMQLLMKKSGWRCSRSSLTTGSIESRAPTRTSPHFSPDCYLMPLAIG